MRTSIIPAVTVMAACLYLAGCGQRGPLYLPPPVVQAPPPATTPAPVAKVDRPQPSNKTSVTPP